MDDYKEYQVGMSWDSYEDSLFRETNTSWPSAYSEEDAIEQVRNEFGHNKGFQIEYIN